LLKRVGDFRGNAKTSRQKNSAAQHRKNTYPKTFQENISFAKQYRDRYTGGLIKYTIFTSSSQYLSQISQTLPIIL
jgi:hypothetical protein